MPQQCLWQHLTVSPFNIVVRPRAQPSPSCKRANCNISDFILGALLAGGSEDTRLEELRLHTVMLHWCKLQWHPMSSWGGPFPSR